ncbi:MAG: redoxin domain-containing protein [Chloroflexota bacterium]
MLVVALIGFGCSPDPEPTPTTEPILVPTSAPTFGGIPVLNAETIDGKVLNISELIGTKPLYVVFLPTATNAWDLEQAAEIQTSFSSFAKYDTQVVAIVSDWPTTVKNMQEQLGIEYPLVADPLGVLAIEWDVFNLIGIEKGGPASFVIDAFGNLAARSLAGANEDRPSIEEVLRVIEESARAGAA